MTLVKQLSILAFSLAEMRDSSGIYGGILHYALIISIVGSAMMVFAYLWSKGRLDMDEEPKIQMMRDDGRENNES